MALRLLTLPSRANAIHWCVRRDGVLVQQQRPFLIGHHHIQHATIPQIGERHGTAIVRVCDPNRLRHVKELPGAIVEPHAFLLIARQTAALPSAASSSHRR